MVIGEGLDYCLQDEIQALENELVFKSQYFIAKGFQFFCASLVIFQGLFLRMIGSIQFDNQLFPGAIKIDNIIFDTLLSSEFTTCQFSLL